MLREQKSMEKASLKLNPTLSDNEGLPVYFLTGDKYLYQTLFCIKSLDNVCAAKLKYILVDDGTFTNEHIERINRQLPGAVVVTQPAIDKNLENILPENDYPVLRGKRKVYPHIKKLTDVHTLPGNEWKLVLDSDMLFWKEPKEIISWLNCPDKPLHMVDCEESYGYSRTLMNRLAGQAIPELLNVGVIGLKSSKIDWKALENWIAELEAREGRTYYLEQALTAMLIGETKASVLPAEKYIVNPLAEAIDAKGGTMHHYVDLSKEGYYKKAWKMI